MLDDAFPSSKIDANSNGAESISPHAAHPVSAGPFTTGSSGPQSGQIIGIWRLGQPLSVNDDPNRAARLFRAQPADSEGSPRYDYVLKTVATGLTTSQADAEQIGASIAVANVSHPNLIAILDASATGATPFIVMPHLAAMTLEERIATTNAISVPVALWFARQVAQATVALHEAGQIHGDIKPRNVLIDDCGHATLIDLGFSARIHSPLRGLFRGTPDYAAPELVEGTTAALPAMDIYAIGRVLWQLLAHAQPTDAASLSAIADLIEATLDPTPTNRPDATSLVASLLQLEIETLGDHIRPLSNAQHRAA
ncbi:MAG: protein kinase family protein [Planctomycetota bacterium]